MARPKQKLDDRDLTDWFVKNKYTPGLTLNFPHGTSKSPAYIDRRATIWFMHQFDPSMIWAALEGAEVTVRRRPHELTNTKRWNMYRIIRAWVAMAENAETDYSRAKALEKLQEFMRLGAACHEEFLQNRGTLLPRTALPKDQTDPVMQSLGKIG